MVPYALEAAGKAGLAKGQLQVLDGTAEELPVGGQTQDAVVCTLVGPLTFAVLLSFIN